MVANIIKIFQEMTHEESFERDFLLQAAIEVTNFLRFKQLVWEFSFENSILVPSNFI